MKKLVWLCAVLFLVNLGYFAHELFAVGTQRYVDPTGSDANAGTIAFPYLTIQKCIDSAVAGDTCNVNDGTYTDNDGNGIVGWIGSGTPSSANGTVSLPITMKSTNPLGAHITVPSTALSGGNQAFYLQRTYWIIEGFDISGGNGTATATANHGINLRTGSDGSIVRKNWIHGIGRVCSDSGFGFTGIYSDAGTGNLIELNVINNIGRDRVGENGCAKTAANGGLTQNDHGIYLHGSTNLTLRRNIMFDVNRGWAIQAFGGTNTNLSIYSNSFGGKDPTGANVGQIILASTINTANLRNNLSYNAQTSFIFFSSSASLTATSILVDHNLSEQAEKNTTHAGVTFSNNTQNTSPGLVNGGADDYQLGTGSAAINVGVDVGLPFNSAPDAGAFETITHGTCSVETATPTMLTITFNNNVAPPLLPATGITGFTARKAGSNNPITTAVRSGTNQVTLTLTNAIVGGDAIDYSYSTSTGNLTDSSLIKGTLNQRLNTVTNQSCVNNVTGGSGALFTQQSFRFYRLQGTEAAPVKLPYASAPENTNIFSVPGGKWRNRFALKCTVANCLAHGFFLRYSRNGAAYTVAPDTFAADHLAFAGTSPDPDIPPSGTVTTEQLTTAGTFVPGALIRSSAAIPTVDLITTSKTELEYVMALDVSANPGDTYDFKMYQQDGTPLDAYAVIPRVTVIGMTAGF